MGIILVKELILIDKGAALRVGDLKMRSAPQLNSATRLYDMLRLFETGRCHMAVLAHNPGAPLPPGTPRGAPRCLFQGTLQGLHTAKKTPLVVVLQQPPPAANRL